MDMLSEIGVNSLDWWVVDLLIIVAYGLQHTLLTTRPAIWLYNKILPDFSWNFVYSVFSIITLVIGFALWKPSHEIIFALVPGSVLYHFMTIILAASLILFFYYFKYTTSFWQWLGVKQIFFKIIKREMPVYYKVRKEGVKKYIRFPHHTCLIVFFWFHPVMTMDTLLLAIGATVYLYLGTYHQDLRGLRVIGKEWEEYRKNTCLLIPGFSIIKKMYYDMKNIVLGIGEINNEENKKGETV